MPCAQAGLQVAFTELFVGGGGLANGVPVAWLTGGGEAVDIEGGVDATVPSVRGTLQSVPVNPATIQPTSDCSPDTALSVS